MFKIKKNLTTTKRKSSKKKEKKVITKKRKKFVDNYIIDDNIDLELNDLNQALIKDYIATCNQETIDYIKNWYIIKCKVSNIGIDITDYSGLRLIIKNKGDKKHYNLIDDKKDVILDTVL